MDEDLKLLEKRNPRYHIVTPIHERDIEYIEESGRARNENGHRLGMVNKSGNSDDKWHILGFAGEWAVALVYNQSINRVVGSTKKELNEADIGGFIDAKTAMTLDKQNLLINVNEFNPNRAYVLCNSHFFPRAIVVMGWEWGEVIYRSPLLREITSPHKTKHQIYIYPHSALRDPIELHPYLRKL